MLWNFLRAQKTLSPSRSRITFVRSCLGRYRYTHLYFLSNQIKSIDFFSMYVRSSSSQAAFQLRNHRRMEADMQKRRSMATTNETKAASLESYKPQHSKWTSTVPPKKTTSSQRLSHGYDPCAEQNTVGTRFLNQPAPMSS